MENVIASPVTESATWKSCPLCDGALTVRLANGVDFWRSKSEDENFQVGFCEPCGQGFSFPVLGQDDLNPYYSHSYGPIQVETGLKRKIVTWKYRREIRQMASRLKPRSRIFEIGAGNGAFVAELAKDGHAVGGLELAAAAVAGAAETYGVKLECGLIEGYRFSARYDLVIMRQVVEHLCDPKAIISEVFHNGLNPGGWLYIKIPCQDTWERRLFGRYWNGWDLPRHRTHYSQAGMQKFLECIGYVDVRVRPELLPNDVVHSLDWLAEFGSSVTKSILKWTWNKLPWLVKIGFGQTVALSLSAFGPGRMTVWARKP